MSYLARTARALFAAVMLFFVAGAQAIPVYVGSFNVFDGPSWMVAPQPLSARQVAAMLFGGQYTDYAISVSSSQDPGSITHSAWVDSPVDTTYLQTPTSEDFLGIPASGLYDDIDAYSAWVCNHADCVADGFPTSAGWLDFNYTNYVWRLVGIDPPITVPEPHSLPLLAMGIVMLIIGRLLHARAKQSSPF